MTYDWDGSRTRRLLMLKLATAVTVGLSIPLIAAVWTYLG